MKTKSNPRRTALSALLLGSVTLLSSRAGADNPIVQTNYTADPAPMVHEGRLYLYTSHDEDNTRDNFYTMDNWRLYSTVDMVNWTDHGSPAKYQDFSWATDSAWAPQGIFRNGQYYLYVPLNNNTGARIGVGVSDNIAGPFTDPLGRELVGTGNGHIDPTVFIDDDDQAYLYWGGNGTLRYVRLNEDMTSYSGSMNTVSLQGFTEGPWFYKREGLYYMVYAALSGTEKISYATSDSPTGPWDYRGDIMAAGSTFTNHPGVVDYQGHSYFFYHNNALPGGGDFKRSVCVEEFSYGDDGSIPTLTMSDEGPDAIASLDPFQQVEAETIAFSSGLKTEVCDDTGAGINVTSISNGDYIKVKDVEFLDGVTSFDARVSESNNDASIELHIDSQDGTLLGTCDVSGTSEWTTKTCEISGGAGKHDLFLKFGGEFKFNWWKFSGPTLPTTGGEGGTGGVGGATSSTSTGTDGGAGGSTTGTSTGTVGGGSSTTGSTVGTVGGGSPTSGGDTATAGGVTSTSSGSSSGGPTTTATSAAATNTTGATGEASSEDGGGCSCRFTPSTRFPGLSALCAAVAIAIRQRRRVRRSSTRDARMSESLAHHRPG